MDFQNKVTVVALQPLRRHETKLDLEKWWINLKIHLKGTQYKEVMLKTWTAKSSDSNRGFTETTVGSKTWTADELSTLVGDMLETILSFIPEIAPSAVLNKATSLEWLFDHVRKHYGCARTGRDMMYKFKTLERKPGEKMTAYWSRFVAFYEDNRIKKDDKLKTDGAKATANEEQCRFSLSSELVLFLFMAHPLLPERMAGILHHKLQDQDVASLLEIILERSQSVLDELEGSHASVNRMYQRPQQQRYQYNRGYQAGAPPERRQYQRQYRRCHTEIPNPLSNQGPQKPGQLLFPLPERSPAQT